MNQKIDIYSISNVNDLSDEQLLFCDHVMTKHKVFTTLEVDAVERSFREEVIWSLLFTNYEQHPKDYSKMRRLMDVIIKKINNQRGFNTVSRINIRKEGKTYNVICKPTKNRMTVDYSRRIRTSATHYYKADKINEDGQLGLQTTADWLLGIEKYASIEDRKRILGELSNLVKFKQEELAALESAQDTAGLIEEINKDAEEKTKKLMEEEKVVCVECDEAMTEQKFKETKKCENCSNDKAEDFVWETRE